MAFTEVSGTITRTFFNGKGAEVAETFKKRDGSEGKAKFALWFDAEHGLAEGDTGKWRGSMSVTVEDWTDKEGTVRHNAKVSLNSVKPIGDGPTSAPAEAQSDPWAQEPTADSWATAAPGAGFDAYDDSRTPF